MEVLPLHKHKDFTDACAEILNVYWPRSKAARIHSLSQSCDHLPVCLAFVRRDANNTEVLGFSKVSAVQGIENAGLVESVIVREVDRGKGLGRALMNLTENYVKKLGITTMYLSTHDQEGFYTRIGYVKCKPVISLGANAHRVPKEMLERLLGISVTSSETTQSKKAAPDGISSQSKPCDKENDQVPVTIAQSTAPIPPAPPPPAQAAPPPPPPPPLPKDHSVAKSEAVSYSRHVSKMDPNSMTWMKKDL